MNLHYHHCGISLIRMMERLMWNTSNTVSLLTHIFYLPSYTNVRFFQLPTQDMVWIVEYKRWKESRYSTKVLCRTDNLILWRYLRNVNSVAWDFCLVRQHGSATAICAKIFITYAQHKSLFDCCSGHFIWDRFFSPLLFAPTSSSKSQVISPRLYVLWLY